MKINNFDCVSMKRKGALRIFKKISQMDASEELAFWKARTTQMVLNKKSLNKKKTIKRK